MNPMHVKITKELKQNFSSKSSQTILIFELKCFLLLYFSDHNELWISETCKDFMWIKNYVKVIPKNDFKKIGNIVYIRYRNLTIFCLIAKVRNLYLENVLWFALSELEPSICTAVSSLSMQIPLCILRKILW